MVSVRGWVIHYAYTSPHKGRNIKVSVCVCSIIHTWQSSPLTIHSLFHLEQKLSWRTQKARFKRIAAVRSADLDAWNNQCQLVHSHEWCDASTVQQCPTSRNLFTQDQIKVPGCSNRVLVVNWKRMFLLFVSLINMCSIIKPRNPQALCCNAEWLG